MDFTLIIAKTQGHSDYVLVRLEISVPVMRIQVVIWSPDSEASKKGGKSAQTWGRLLKELLIIAKKGVVEFTKDLVCGDCQQRKISSNCVAMKRNIAIHS
jgi:hypothetical protein